jgi:hypothetical protein
MDNRRALYAAIAGTFLTVAPLLIQRSTESDPWRTGAGLFMMPGALVGIGLAGGVVHGIAWQVLVVANCVFYSGFAYLILSAWARLRAGFRDRSASAERENRQT